MKLRHIVVCSALCLTVAGCPAPEETPTPAADDGAKGEGDAKADEAPAAPPPAPFNKATAKTPWKHAKVGDWALYSMPTAGREMRFEVTGVTDDTVTFTVTNTKTNEVSANPTLQLADEETRYKDPFTYDAYAKDKDGNEIKPYKEKVSLKGKDFEALVIKRAKEGMGSTELWIAEEHVRPFNQCAVKSIRNGKLELELVDFGPFEGGKSE